MIKNMLIGRSFMQSGLDIFKIWAITGFMVVVAFFATVQGQDSDQDDFDVAFQELIYDIGINLAGQDMIVDLSSAVDALLNVYQQVPEVMQIVDLYIMIDEELVEENITTIEDLITFEIDNNQAAVQAGAVWLSAYQNLFMIFSFIHEEDSSFDVWCSDMAYFESIEDDEEILDPNYLLLWRASCDMLDAQQDFEYALKNLE